MKKLPLSALVATSFALVTQVSSGADFLMLNDPDLGTTNFEQRWNQAAIWQYVSGVDDGTVGIPDGDDTFTINRSVGGFAANATDLSNELMPNGHTIAGITGTGAPGRDIVLKLADLTIGDLTVLASASTFEILEERDKDLTINGVISGAGNLVLSRAGGFSDGVTPDELITITGAAPNTITGTILLYNSNTGGQPSYWVADKVGAFGQTPELTLRGNPGGSGSGETSLQFTANTSGGEGAIDDDATDVYIGFNGVFSMDTGVNETIGSGKLFIDIAGTGSYTAVPDGVYNNTEVWITGDGTVTVGVPVPIDPVITSITDVGGGVWQLTLSGEANTAYEFRSSTILDFSPGTLVDGLAPGVPAVGTISGGNNEILTTDGNGDATARMALAGPKNFVIAQILIP